MFRPTALFFLSGLSAVVTYNYVKIASDRSSRFIHSTLIQSVHVSPNSKLLTLSVPPGLIKPDSSPIYSIFIKDSDIQVERPYTPLEGIDENGHVKLWVKKYDHGEVSRWLHSRQVGDSIEIRGPVQTWPSSWQNGQWDDVLMISGGTGITPFYQLLRSVFRSHDTSSIPRFTLLHASRSLADLPPSCMIQPLTEISQKYPDRFQFHLFADSIDDARERRSLSIQCGRIGKSVVQAALRLPNSTPWWRRLFGQSTSTPSTSEKNVLVLVCGPEGMLSAIAGPYGHNYSQGKVGGILGELGLQPHQVWKF